ncbi:MAG: FkbM family methyltransferase [Terracidiphilus sp.]|jgi:FkbM family methyltransferase
MLDSASTTCGYNLRTTAPPLFRLAKYLTRRKVRGGFRLQAFASRGCVVQYDLGNGFHLTVPIYREDNRIDREEILGYEAQLVKELSAAAGSMQDITLIDCGADIGLISVTLRRAIPAIGHVVAFEPNAEVLPFLSRNLSMLPCPALMIGHAVGNIEGAGRLERPPSDDSDHARYLVPDPKGSIRVITIDSLGIMGDILLKIDVEGAEHTVIEGAVETIRQAPRCVVSLEAHPEVAARTGIDPLTNLRRLQAIRPFRFVVAGGTATREIHSLDEPLFPPGAPKEILNVVAASIA